jgi:uncharacterized membrane protein
MFRTDVSYCAGTYRTYRVRAQEDKQLYQVYSTACILVFGVTIYFWSSNSSVLGLVGLYMFELLYSDLLQ